MRINRTQLMIPLVIAFSVVWVHDATAIIIRNDQPVADYNALALRPEYQSAGYFLDFHGSTTTASVCSGVLVSSTEFLTAAHCLLNNPLTTDLYVRFDTNFPNSISISNQNVVGYQINPHYTGTLSKQDVLHDQAIIKLGSPVTSITPAKILTGSFSPNLLVAMIGYGTQGDGLGNSISGANSRLGAENITTQGTPDFRAIFEPPRQPGQPPTGAVRLEGALTNGDSGGPLYTFWSAPSIGIPPLWYLIGDACCGNSNSLTYGLTDFWSPLGTPDNVSFLKDQGLRPGIELFGPVDSLSVPEPSTLLLLLLGWLGFMFGRRIRL